jgi:hypothetical protein
MSLFKLFIYGLIIYFAIKLVKVLFKPAPPKSEIKGSPNRKKPIDLSGADIEDADFKEIDEE